MYNLTNKAIELIKSDMDLRFAIAKAMGNNEGSVMRSIYRQNGKSIAESYDAMGVLIDRTGLIDSDLRQPINQTA